MEAVGSSSRVPAILNILQQLLLVWSLLPIHATNIVQIHVLRVESIMCNLEVLIVVVTSCRKPGQVRRLKGFLMLLKKTGEMCMDTKIATKV